MKFETLKEKCAKYAYNHTMEPQAYTSAAWLTLENIKETGKPAKYLESLKKLKNDAWDMIMRTDIRNVKALADQFPNIVPSWVKAGNYTPELTDNGWELINTSNPY